MTDEEHETWARASQYASPRDAALLRLLNAARVTLAERDRQIANPCAKIFEHKWLDADCVESGCRTLILEARVAVLEAALRTLIGHCEIAAVCPQAIGKTLVYALNGPELNEARAALAASDPRVEEPGGKP